MQFWIQKRRWSFIGLWIGTRKTYLSGAVEAETTGWVGFGFSDSGQMAGSDVVIGWVKDNNGYLKVRKC